MDQQNFNLMFEEAVFNLTGFVVSESDAFPSVQEVQEMPEGQQHIVNEKYRKTQERAVPVVRAFLKNFLLK